MKFDINWFKNSFVDELQKFDVEFLEFKDGDLGDLHEVRGECERLCFTISFWSSGYVGIHVFSFAEDDEIVNRMSNVEFEINSAFDELRKTIS